MGNSCKITFEKKMMSLGIILCMQGNVWRLHTLGRIWVYFNYNVDMYKYSIYKYSIYKYQWTSKDQKLCCCWNADWHCNGAMSGLQPRQCVGRGARANLGAAENGYPKNCKIHRNTDDETLEFGDILEMLDPTVQQTLLSRLMILQITDHEGNITCLDRKPDGSQQGGHARACQFCPWQFCRPKDVPSGKLT